MTGRGRTWRDVLVRRTALVLGAGLLVTGLTGCGLRDRAGAAEPRGTGGSAATIEPAEEPTTDRTAAEPAADPAADPAAESAAEPADAAPDEASSADVAAVESLVEDALDTVASGEAAVASDG